jgi:uncharacterized membrane protein HdeD (DUF308 family)
MEKTLPRSLDNALTRNWWALLIRGFLGVAFGVLTWVWPGMTLMILVTLFGVYALVDGVFAVVSAVRAARRQERWWPVALEGALGLAAGVVTFVAPLATAFALLIIVAAWALSTGVLQIVAAIRLRKHIRGEWLLALAGVLSVAVGVLLILRPGAGLMALVWWIGAYAFASGLIMIALAIKLKRLAAPERRVEPSLGGPTPHPV